MSKIKKVANPFLYFDSYAQFSLETDWLPI